MKIDKQQVAGYGLHYHANNLLIPNISVRTLLQCIVDITRRQLHESLDNQTIIVSLGQLGRLTGIDPYRTIPACLDKLESLGLIKKHKNGITLQCNEYVASVQLCETLPKQEKERFIDEFQKSGVKALHNCSTPTFLQGREALVGMTGNSFVVESDLPLQKCRDFDFATQNPYKNVGILTSQTQNPTFLQGYDSENQIKENDKTPTFLQGLAHEIAKTLHFCRGYRSFDEFCDTLPPTFLQGEVFKFIKYAFETGEVPNTFTYETENPYIFAGGTPTFLQGLASKSLQFCRTVIIGDNKKDNNRILKNENEENEQENIKKGLEDFGKVEIIELNGPSDNFDNFDNFKEGSEQVTDDYSQQVINRAGRKMRERNRYRNKPFLKVDKVKEKVDYLDEVIQSPVDFFLYNFWWGIFDLYCEHYHPSQKINEEGEPVEDDSQYLDWKEMIGAPLPQDEIYSLAENVYDDLLGAVEQGIYVFGDNNQWESKFAFSSFEDFIPYEIFQWTPCTMKDKSIPALRVAIDKFYDIEAEDVFVPTKGDKRAKNAMNKKFTQLLIASEDSQLTPMENAIKKFYRDFVITGRDGLVDEFTDGRGTVLESGGGLPDHLLKPWCYDLPSIGYNEFTDIFSTKYKPCEGVHKKAYIFSAEKVVEWNERNGYKDTVAHKAIS